MLKIRLPRGVYPERSRRAREDTLRSFDFAQDKRAVRDWLHNSINAEERQRNYIRTQVLRLRANGSGHIAG